MRIWVPLVATLASACAFDGPASTGSDDAPPVVEPAALDLTAHGRWRYDTDTNVLTAPDGAPSTPRATIEGSIRVIEVDHVRIGELVELRATGMLALRIVSGGDVRIDGLVDVGSYWDENAYSTGAGVSSTTGGAGMCPVDAPKPGATCKNHGGSGGGGGGFGGAGGHGGVGGETHDCDDGVNTSGVPGGVGGVPTPNPVALRGGCGGRPGGFTTDVTSAEAAGLGGPGGGAVEIVAADRLEIDGGVVRAGGAGGRGSAGFRAGGGGGGSGGMIVLAAPAIELRGARIVANGGGGGGGADMKTGMPGADALLETAASGGASEDANGGGGGDGGHVEPVDGALAAPASRGGGGGGGGAGVIRLRGTLMMSNAKISPAPRVEPL